MKGAAILTALVVTVGCSSPGLFPPAPEGFTQIADTSGPLDEGNLPAKMRIDTQTLRTLKNEGASEVLARTWQRDGSATSLLSLIVVPLPTPIHARRAADRMDSILKSIPPYQPDLRAVTIQDKRGFLSANTTGPGQALIITFTKEQHLYVLLAGDTDEPSTVRTADALLQLLNSR